MSLYYYILPNDDINDIVRISGLHRNVAISETNTSRIFVVIIAFAYLMNLIKTKKGFYKKKQLYLLMSNCGGTIYS